ncbi:MAG: sulfate transporter CysZ [Methylococcaceae bacterium]|nr:sulfate transporter CysZ [Methylococcaceae bacterium]
MISFVKKKGNNPVYVIACLLKGLRFLAHAQLRKFLLIPIIINLLLYSIAFGLAFFYMDDVTRYLLPDWLEAISWLSWLSKLLGILFFICFFLIAFFTFTILANLIASPFYGKLSERTLALLIERETPEGEEVKLPEAPPELPLMQMLYGEWLRIRYLLAWIVLLVILSLIPVLNIIAPILWALFGAWGMALEYFTYPLENRGLLFPEQKKLASSVRFGALSFGGFTVLGLMIPVVNILVSPVAVIAATISTHGISKDDEQEQPENKTVNMKKDE